MNSRSDGPDKLNMGYACYLHHSGIRYYNTYDNTGVGKHMLMDYQCCCNPCLYTKTDRISMFPQGGEESSVNHCCRCNPNLIVASWVADSSGDPCSQNEETQALFLDLTSSNASEPYAKYAGTLVGRNIQVALSNFSVDPSGGSTLDGSGCRWSIFLSDPVGAGGGGEPGVGGTPSWDSYIEHVQFIDHNEVTCLGIPNVTFTGVTSFEGSGGSISLYNFDSSKVPFIRRADSFSEYVISKQSNEGFTTNYGTSTGVPNYEGILGEQIFTPPISGELTVTLPSSIISPPKIDPGWTGDPSHTYAPWPMGMSPTGLIPLNSICTQVPKFLCVHKTTDSSPTQYYREFVYNTGFFPIQRMEFHPSYPDPQYFTTGNALAQWTYIPINYGGSGQIPTNEKEQHLFLYESYVDEVVRFSGNMDQVRASGQPTFRFVPIFQGNPLPIGKDDHVWPGGPYYSHPAINYADYDLWSDIQNRNENENFYWVPDSGGVSRNRTLTIGNMRQGSSIHYSDGRSCPCRLTSFGSTFDGVSATTDHFVNIKPGKCSCWQYLCSNACRCVPTNMCLYSYEYNGTGTPTASTHSLQWNPNSFCWVQDSGGANEITICLGASDLGFTAGDAGETYTGACSVSLGGDYYSDMGHSFSSDKITSCDFFDMFFSFSSSNGTGANQTGAFVSVVPAIGSCDLRIGCDYATPCYENCGSHPQSLNLHLFGYSVSGLDECGEGGIDCSQTCEKDIFLVYKQDISLASEDPFQLELNCYYEGYVACGDNIVQVLYAGGNSAPNFFIWDVQGVTGGGTLSIAIDDPEWNGSFSQSCDPYLASGTYNYGFPASPFYSCGESCSVHRIDFTITEG